MRRRLPLLALVGALLVALAASPARAQTAPPRAQLYATATCLKPGTTTQVRSYGLGFPQQGKTTLRLSDTSGGPGTASPQTQSVTYPGTSWGPAVVTITTNPDTPNGANTGAFFFVADAGSSDPSLTIRVSDTCPTVTVPGCVTVGAPSRVEVDVAGAKPDGRTVTAIFDITGPDQAQAGLPNVGRNGTTTGFVGVDATRQMDYLVIVSFTDANGTMDDASTTVPPCAPPPTTTTPTTQPATTTPNRPVTTKPGVTTVTTTPATTASTATTATTARATTTTLPSVLTTSTTLPLAPIPGIPVIALVPAIGRGGEPTTVLGNGWRPGELVTLLWAPGIGAHSVVAGPDGTFRLPVLVFHKDVQGDRLMKATSATGAAQASYLVVPSSVEPAGDDAAVVFRAS